MVILQTKTIIIVLLTAISTKNATLHSRPKRHISARLTAINGDMAPIDINGVGVMQLQWVQSKSEPTKAPVPKLPEKVEVHLHQTGCEGCEELVDKSGGKTNFFIKVGGGGRESSWEEKKPYWGDVRVSFAGRHLGEVRKVDWISVNYTVDKKAYKGEGGKELIWVVNRIEIQKRFQNKSTYYTECYKPEEKYPCIASPKDCCLAKDGKVTKFVISKLGKNPPKKK